MFATGPADLVNIAVVVAFDAAVIYTCGLKSIVYLLAGTVFGGGLHPMAGHLISEHYMFVKVRLLQVRSCCAVLNTRLDEAAVAASTQAIRRC